MDMEQLRKLLRSLTLKQKISAAVVALLVGAAFYGFSYWHKESDFRPLYTNLPAEDAGAVVQKLKELGAEYRVSDSGGTVLAPSARVAELRLEMARAQLPRAGRIGFELFDKTNLGTTDFAEQVNYRRALEGELERSVSALAAVEQARVHITFPKESVYLESQTPAKASVLLRLRLGTRMEPHHIAAITHLVSSAVEGLSPDTVSVMDMQGNLLNRPHDRPDQTDGLPDRLTEYRQQIEKDLLHKIDATLAPLLGAGRYQAGVSVECDLTSGEVNEEVFDPTKSIMLASQRSEDSSGNLASAGIPGTASSLPRPAPRNTALGAGVSRKTENVTYQSSRTVRRTRIPQGVVRRLSVSVLLDQDLRWEKNGSSLQRVLDPPAPEKIKAIRDLVAGLVNLQADRGDQVVVETLAFESTLKTPAPPAPPAPVAPGKGGWPIPIPEQYQKLVILGAGALLVLLVLGSVILFLVMRKRRRKRQQVAAEAAAQIAAAKAEHKEIEADEHMQAQIAGHQKQQDDVEEDILSRLKMPVPKTEKAEVLSKHLREIVKKDSTIPVEVLRRWISDR
jgi:flagellar M-ring protein FliF